MRAESTAPPQSDLLLDLYCPECGYSLRGIRSARCPECGLQIDHDQLHESQIPWVRRREIGEATAYWKTVWLVLLRPRQFFLEIARPIGLAEARRFRWSTLSRVYIPVLLVTIVMYLFEPLQRFSSTLVNWAYQTVWPVVVMHICFILFLATASGIPTVFFRPKHLPPERQYRAVALSYYVLAPLGLMPLAYLVSFFAYWADILVGRAMWNWRIVNLSIAVLPALLVVWWYAGLLRLIARTLHRDSEYVFIIGLVLPLLWVLLGFALMVLLPGIVAYVAVMVMSWS